MTHLWNTAGPIQPQPVGAPFRGQSTGLSAVAFGRQDRTLATAGAEGSVLFWDLHDLRNVTPSGRPFRCADAFDGAQPIAIAPDRQTLACATNDGVQLWDVRNPQQPTRTSWTIPGQASNLAFARTRTLAVGDKAGHLSLWHVPDDAGPARLGPTLDAGGEIEGARVFTRCRHARGGRSSRSTAALGYGESV